jgi:transposase
MGEVSKGRFAARVRELAIGHAMLGRITEPMLRAREALRTEYAKLHGEMLVIVKPDPVCRRLMTVPGVGALVAITFKSAVDDPGRFARSRVLGAHFGLTPRRYQSGETDVTGAISRVGDAMVRGASRPSPPYNQRRYLSGRGQPTGFRSPKSRYRDADPVKP